MARYKFYKADNKTICVSSFAKKPVRGIAKCSPHDVYDADKGMRLAQLRCDLKVAEKRMEKARNRKVEAMINLNQAKYEEYLADQYYTDSLKQYQETQKWLMDFEKNC